jgi:hypothetical protein
VSNFKRKGKDKPYEIKIKSFVNTFENKLSNMEQEITTLAAFNKDKFNLKKMSLVTLSA